MAPLLSFFGRFEVLGIRFQELSGRKKIDLRLATMSELIKNRMGHSQDRVRLENQSNNK